MAGLSAAHELCTRGFDVHVYEKEDRVGGKARSFDGPGGGAPPLPAEHGFRFLPDFYWHLPQTMKEIPAGRATRWPTTSFTGPRCRWRGRTGSPRSSSR